MNCAASLSSVLMMGRYGVRARRWVSVISHSLFVLLDDAFVDSSWAMFSAGGTD
jgi:hypothetical protein